MQVSTVIPTYNSEDYLERAFASAIEQKGVTFEIIIVDNNSTDGTVALAEKLRLQHPKLVRVGHEPKQGSAAARNHGVRLAEGEWIQFLDSDDVLLPGKLQRQLTLVDDSVDWVTGASIRRSITGERTVSTINSDPWKGLVHNGGVGDTNSNLIRRDIYVCVGGQDEEMSNGVDTYLYFRLLKEGARCIPDNEPGAIYLDRLGFRLSTIESPDSRQRSVHLKAAVLNYLESYEPDYFRKNEPFFRSSLLNALRILATLNLNEAHDLFRLYFPSGVIRSHVDKSIASHLILLYPVFGFYVVELVRLNAVKLFPVGFLRKFKRV